MPTSGHETLNFKIFMLSLQFSIGPWSSYAAHIEGIVVWILTRVTLYIFWFVILYTIIASKLFVTILRLRDSINDLQDLLTVWKFFKVNNAL
jgi:hypothetical protein